MTTKQMIALDCVADSTLEDNMTVQELIDRLSRMQRDLPITVLYETHNADTEIFFEITETDSVNYEGVIVLREITGKNVAIVGN